MTSCRASILSALSYLMCHVCRYQHTLYASDAVVAIRSKNNMDEILDFAIKAKTSGNTLYNQQRFEEARYEYEHVLGMFNYLEPTDPEWQKKDIDDDRMAERDVLIDRSDLTISEEQRNKIYELKLSCLLNIGRCYSKLTEHSTCIRACDMALLLDSENVKALYLRAVARVTPAGAGMMEHEAALADLKLAHRLAPTNKTISDAYTGLKQTLANQIKKDKETFNGLFERGSLGYGDDDGDDSGKDKTKVGKKDIGIDENMTWEEGLAKIRDAEMMAKQMVIIKYCCRNHQSSFISYIHNRSLLILYVAYPSKHFLCRHRQGRVE